MLKFYSIIRFSICEYRRKRLTIPNTPGAKKFLFLLLPVLLILSTSGVFYFCTKLWNPYVGYLAGFLFYWLFWCLLIPLWVSGHGLRDFFRDTQPLLKRNNWWIIILLASTVIAPVFMYFIPAIKSTPLPVILLSIPLAVIHGFFEELFWRGIYIKEFPDNTWWNLIIPSLLFSLWHFAPQWAIPADNRLIFVVSTLPLGFTYALTARVTGSARWSAIAHSLSGILAFSGNLAISIYQLIK